MLGVAVERCSGARATAERARHACGRRTTATTATRCSAQIYTYSYNHAHLVQAFCVLVHLDLRAGSAGLSSKMNSAQEYVTVDGTECLKCGCEVVVACSVHARHSQLLLAAPGSWLARRRPAACMLRCQTWPPDLLRSAIIHADPLSRHQLLSWEGRHTPFTPTGARLAARLRRHSVFASLLRRRAPPWPCDYMRAQTRLSIHLVHKTPQQHCRHQPRRLAAQRRSPPQKGTSIPGGGRWGPPPGGQARAVPRLST